MKLYHVRSGTPNYEAICVDRMYQGWNPGRDSGLFGTGLYCTLTPPRIREPATLYVYEVDATLYKVVSLDHERTLGEFVKALTRFVVSSLHRLYTTAKRAPLVAWYEHYSAADYMEYKRELVEAIEALPCASDPLTKHLRAALRDREDLLFDFVCRYAEVVKGPSIEPRCDSRPSPFTTLLTSLGYEGLMYEGDASFLNNRESHGVVLFDTTLPPVSEVSWTAEYRVSLLLCADLVRSVSKERLAIRRNTHLTSMILRVAPQAAPQMLLGSPEESHIMSNPVLSRYLSTSITVEAVERPHALGSD
jgi:hypothetical protein